MTDFVEAAELLARIKALVKREDEDRIPLACYILAGVLVFAAIAALCYAIYKFFKPDYMKDFDEELEEDLDDEFFDDEDFQSGTGA